MHGPVVNNVGTKMRVAGFSALVGHGVSALIAATTVGTLDGGCTNGCWLLVGF